MYLVTLKSQTLYFVQLPQFLNQISPKNITWCKPNTSRSVYLTFDDGPHPEITPWILSELTKHQAKATFFCLGENAMKYEKLIHAILEEGHTIGNHGYRHVDGWKVSSKYYLENYQQGKTTLEAITGKEINLYRPPYGKFRLDRQIPVCMWSLMPGDFDKNRTGDNCLKNLLKAKSGDIIVLHDNEKSFPHLKYSLPLFLEKQDKIIFQKL